MNGIQSTYLLAGYQQGRANFPVEKIDNFIKKNNYTSQ